MPAGPVEEQDDMIPENYLLTDQVAIVTGGGGGLGRAIALALAGAGADIVIADIVPERCEETAERVRELGRIDILVNNAGGTGFRPFIDQPEKSWRRHIDLNLVSMFAATSAAVPVMIKGGRGGSIINVTSIEGTRAAPNAAVYAACKAGMNNFTMTMALELSDHRIRVNAIAPDYTVTPGLSGNIGGPVDPSKWIRATPEQEAATARRIPLGRPGIDTECGNAALFLASAMASYVTGIVLPVDGGSAAAQGWQRLRKGGWGLTEAML
jgi:NAD(P)-dependent dehydrogenase (short-subunit alcohol dehydrogenase family)